MEHLGKFNSNAISDDTPSYFKCNYVEVKRNVPQNLGKRIYPKPTMKNILAIKPERPSQSQVRIHMGYSDQDLDSLKLSIQPDITRGYKNTVRFKSNHYKSFFEKIETVGYRRLSSEITSLHKLPQIVRTLKSESKSKTRQITVKARKNEQSEEMKSTELSYLLELHSSKSKQKSIPIPKAAKNIKIEDQIDWFEQNLKNNSFEKSKNVYEQYEVKNKLGN